MKKRLRKTGEIVDVITYNDCSSKTKRKKYDYVGYIDSNGTPHYLERGLNIYWDFEDVEEELTKWIDWEQVRIRAAIEALKGFAANPHDQAANAPVQKLSEWSVQAADSLIAELKKGGNNEAK